EEQERVVMRLPLLVPAVAELERAGDPEVARVEADDLLAGVKDPAIARPGTPERDRLDVARRRHPIAGRHVVASAEEAGDARHPSHTEREGFEPSSEVNPRYAISSRARSTAPAPLLVIPERDGLRVSEPYRRRQAM